MTPNTESAHGHSKEIDEFDEEGGANESLPAAGAPYAPLESDDEQVILERLERMGLTLDRALTAFRKEHHTDHRLLLSILTDQNARIRAVERALRSARSAAAG